MATGNPSGGLPTAPAGQPGNASEAAPVPVAQPNPEQQGGATTQPLTLETILEAVDRRIQSRNDQQLNRIQKIIEAGKAKGLEITQEQATQIAAVTDSQPQPTPTPMTPAPSPAAPAQVPAGGAAADPAMAIAENWMNEDGKTAEERSIPSTVEAYRLMAASGVRLTPDDVEINGIVVNKGQVAYLDSIRAAIAAKQARLSAQGSPGRLPAIGGSAPSTEPQHKGMSGIDTLTMGINQQFHGTKP